MSRDAQQTREPVAIIGIGCRFPGGATTPEAFWHVLSNGVDAVTEVPPDRWDIRTYYDPDRSKQGKAVTRWGAFLNQIDQFDAQFFGISPREAAYLDPQQRLLLETCWEALEDGAQAPDTLTGSQVGVFIGCFTLDYKVLQFTESNRHLMSGHTATGAMMTLVANRISHAFDFRGPSVAIDTACSSSLVAVHLACQSLRDGECTIALAGGVNVMLKPEYTIAESQAGMLSPDGRCKVFDSNANGYVRGEGAGVVVLKPLSQALADGDPIYAVVRGTAINQDGHTPGITVPSGEAQQALMRECYRRAGVSPGQIQYVEAHGTGTPVGDPIEANALGTVLSTDRPEGNDCYVGSLKTNIGHTEAAAGVAGLIKAALCLKHRQIPPHLHLKEPNPQISFAQLRLRVPTTLTQWPDTEGPALAAVNSFGFGGTNAHAVLEEAPRVSPVTLPAPAPARALVLPLSARGPEALAASARAYRDFLGTAGAGSLRDMCYTASQRRAHHTHRLAMVVHSREEVAERLDAFLACEARPGMTAGNLVQAGAGRPRIAFVFTGMGPQWWAMGRQLLAEEPVFAEAVHRVDLLLTRYTGWSLLEAMLADEAVSRMAETEVAQPANFALQVGLVELWRSWGIVPDAVVGHSAGEPAAAYAAGALGLEEAVRVTYHRSRLQQRTTGQGKLVAVGLPMDEARALVESYNGRVSFAAINSPGAVTLVGDPDALTEVIAPLQARGVFCRYLQVKVPYHSHYMEPLRAELLDSLQELELRPTAIPLYSTVTGKLISGHDLDAAYWWRNVREPVYFAAAAHQLIQDGYDLFLEVGPHPVLSSSITECVALLGRQGVSLPSLRRGAAERAVLLDSAGALYTQGLKLAWDKLAPEGGRFTPLPTYPWQRERYWNESPASAGDRLGRKGHPLLGNRLNTPEPMWEVELSHYHLPYLQHHKIQGTVVYPGAAYVEMALAAARQVFGDAAAVMNGEEIEFRKALFVPDQGTLRLQLVLNPKDASFGIYSNLIGEAKPWTLHATGRLRAHGNALVTKLPLAELRNRCATEVPSEVCYQRFRSLGLEYGESFRGIRRLWQGPDEALAQIRVPEAILSEIDAYNIHPAVLDQCFQVLAAALPFDGAAGATVYMPTGVEQGALYGKLTPNLWIHARIEERQQNLLKGDIRLSDESGNVLLEIRGCRAVSLTDNENTTLVRPQVYYEFQWHARERREAKQTAPDRQAAQPATWLIFADKQGVGRTLAGLLEVRGEHCVLVTPGDTYRSGDRAYQVNPANPADFQQLLADALGDDQPPCRGVVHLWSLDAAPPAETTVESLRKATLVGCTAVLHLVQALARQTWRRAPRLWLATRGSQQAGPGTDTLNPAQAALWGIARGIGHQEHMDLWGGIVDLDPAAPTDEAAVLCEELWHADGEDQVAFRGGERYVARLDASTAKSLALPPTFRPDAGYLITGGLGGLGLLVARWMVQRGARRLILVGREKLPPRTAWHGTEPGSTLAFRIAAIRDLEAMGATVHLAAADVTDEAALASILTEYDREGWPAIRGVVHSAGVARPQLMLHMDMASFNTVMDPKALGAWNLHQCFADKPLDFFVLFSSIAALVVSAGQGNYSAGNAFMDALAHYRRSMGLPGLSINWGPWAEVGMATKLDLVTYFERRGLYPMTPQQGLNALGDLLGQNHPQVTVVAADWPVVAERNYPMGIPPAMLSELVALEREASAGTAAPETSENILEALRHSDSAMRGTLLAEHLQDLAARVLRLNRSKLDPQQPLNSLGLDSMMAIELKNHIERSLSVSIPVVDILKGGSAAHLAADIMPQLQLEQADADVTAILAQAEDLSAAELEALLETVATSAEEEN